MSAPYARISDGGLAIQSSVLPSIGTRSGKGSMPGCGLFRSEQRQATNLFDLITYTPRSPAIPGRGWEVNIEFYSKYGLDWTQHRFCLGTIESSGVIL